jgi:hypothetical protein
LELEAEDGVDLIGVEWRRAGMRWTPTEDGGGGKRGRTCRPAAAEEGYRTVALLVWVGGGALAQRWEKGSRRWVESYRPRTDQEETTEIVNGMPKSREQLP